MNDNPCKIVRSMHYETDTEHVWTVEGTYVGDPFMCTILFEADGRDAEYHHIHGVEMGVEHEDGRWDNLLQAMGKEEMLTTKEYTGTWYGRGEPLHASAAEHRVRSAYRRMRNRSKGQPIYLDVDEDAFFTPEKPDYESGQQPVIDEEDAIKRWWEGYGSSMPRVDAEQFGYLRFAALYGDCMLDEE